MSAITFRRLVETDLPVLHGWLNEPGVVAWWEGDDVSWHAVVRDYWADVDDYTEHWLALDGGGDPFGWIQCWDARAELADTPDGEVPGWLLAGLELEGLAGIDYLVGEPGHRGLGRGSEMIDGFVEDVVFGRHDGWRTVAASPYVENRASWRSLERAGFDHVTDLVHEGDTKPCRLMARRRP